MEDFVSIIWVLVVIGAMIYNAATKAKGKKNGEKPTASGEAWPAMELPAEPAHGAPPRSAAPRKTAATDPSPAFSSADSAARAASTSNASSSFSTSGTAFSPSDSAFSAAAVAKKPSVAEASEAAQPIDEALGEPFDLRRAVIYAELLAPKFDE